MEIRNALRALTLFLFLLLLAACVFGADTTPPSVSITAPITNEVVSGIYTVEVTATDASGVTNVTISVDGNRVGDVDESTPFTFLLNTRLFNNGFRTIMATAIDGAGNAARSDYVPVTNSNRIPKLFKGGTYNLNSLGDIMQANVQQRLQMLQLTNGDIHMLVHYINDSYGTIPGQFLDVNLTQETSTLIEASHLGRPAIGSILHWNGNIYLYSGDPGYLMEYDPETGDTNVITKFHPTFRNDGEYGTVNNEGEVWIGGFAYTGATFYAYTPATSNFVNFGAMDESFTSSQYCTSIRADDRYVYMGLGQIPFYLGIYDTVTSNKTIHWKTNYDNGGKVWLGSNNVHYYWRSTTNAGNKYYILTNDTPVEVSEPDAFGNEWDYTNVINDIAYFDDAYSIEVDLGSAYPDSGNGNTAIISWRTVGATNWTSVTNTDFRLEPVQIDRLFAWTNNQLIGWVDFYGPVFTYDTVTDTAVTLGRPQISLYDFLFEETKIFFGGYPSGFLDYDIFESWNLTSSTTNQFDSSVNPQRISLDFGRYNYYLARGADGLIYFGAHHERSSTGGELGWYDPLFGTNGSYIGEFYTNDVRDLKAILGGTKLVYLSETTNLYVFDISSKSIERTIVPLPSNAEGLGKAVEVGDGIIFGAANDSIFKVDANDGTIMHTETVGSTVMGWGQVPVADQRVTYGGDGHIWMFVDSNIVRFNADTYVTNIIASGDTGGITFLGNNAYVYGDTNLFYLENLFEDSFNSKISGSAKLGGSVIIR